MGLDECIGRTDATRDLVSRLRHRPSQMPDANASPLNPGNSTLRCSQSRWGGVWEEGNTAPARITSHLERTSWSGHRHTVKIDSGEDLECVRRSTWLRLKRQCRRH